MPQPGGRESPGSGERTTQLPQDKTDGQSRVSAPAAGEQRAAQQGARPPLPRARLPAGPPLPGPGAEPLAAPGTGRSGQREQPAALPGRPGRLGLVREPHGLQDPEGSPGPAEQMPGGSARLPGTVGARRGGAEAPEAPKAAWPGLPGGEQASAGVSAAQQETALQRLLELHRAARGARGPAGRPLTAASPRSWNASASPGTATAGCTLWGPHPARPSSRHRQASREKAAGPRRSCPGGAGRLPGPFRARAPRSGADAEGGRAGASARVLPPAGSLRPARWAAGASAQRPPQEDAAGRRRALREELQRGLQERTRRLRALGAR